jgi:hypothetical protein
VLDWLNGVHQLLEDVGVVDVGRGEHYYCEWDPLSVRNNMALGEPGLPLSVGFLAVFSPPF